MFSEFEKSQQTILVGKKIKKQTFLKPVMSDSSDVPKKEDPTDSEMDEMFSRYSSYAHVGNPFKSPIDCPFISPDWNNKTPSLVCLRRINL